MGYLLLTGLDGLTERAPKLVRRLMAEDQTVIAQFLDGTVKIFPHIARFRMMDH